jgi:hypothetical protein
MASALIGGERDVEATAPPAWDTAKDTRFMTMSIASRGAATIVPSDTANTGAKSAHKLAASLRETNGVADIRGAQPQPRMGRWTHNRPDLFAVDDIEKAAPGGTKLLNKPCTINKVDDIDGARPSRRTFRTNRHVNPMDPVYQLPSTKERAITPPRFLRDSMDVSDIGGTKPRESRGGDRPNLSLDVSDIPGARHRVKEMPPPRDILNAKLVDKPSVQRHFRSSRVTNPLDPVHVIHGAVVEPDPLSRPTQRKVMHEADGSERGVLSLRTRDIPGAQPGWKPPHKGAAAIPEDKRRDFRDVTRVSDIHGAQAGTVKKGITTTRVTDPNDRIYPTLDGKPTISAAESSVVKSLSRSRATLAESRRVHATTMSESQRMDATTLSESRRMDATVDSRLGGTSASLPMDQTVSELQAKVEELETKLAAREAAWKASRRVDAETVATHTEDAIRRAEDRALGAGAPSTELNRFSGISHPPSYVSREPLNSSGLPAESPRATAAVKVPALNVKSTKLVSAGSAAVQAHSAKSSGRRVSAREQAEIASVRGLPDY